MIGPLIALFNIQNTAAKQRSFVLLRGLLTIVMLQPLPDSFGATPPSDDMPEEISLEETQAESPPSTSSASSELPPPPQSQPKKPKNQKKTTHRHPQKPTPNKTLRAKNLTQKPGTPAKEESPSGPSDAPPSLESSETAEVTDSPAQWESYRDGGNSLQLQDVSQGVKIEDIVEPPSEYHYAAFGKPDPFRPVKRSAKFNANLMDDPIESIEVPILSTLQLVDLKSVLVLGIWQGADGTRKAMVTAQSPIVKNQSFIVKTGDPIGNRGGIIHSIESDHIKVNEFELLKDGTRQINKKELPFYLSINVPPENLGSWIFNPGVPNPLQKTPLISGNPNTGTTDTNIGPSGAGGSPLPFGIPQSMLQPSGAGGLRRDINQLLGQPPAAPPSQAQSMPSIPPTPSVPASAPSAYNPNGGKPPMGSLPASQKATGEPPPAAPAADDKKIKAF